ncbi:MAG: GWxTD domain-containing protein [Flavobacteriales bacterium]|nr:GWxTD domain-containing protein [Flavobacteriales bacterium]
MKTHNRFIATHFILFVVQLFFSCTSYQGTTANTFKYLYDYESNVLHPEYLLYHFTDDSSALYVKMNTIELLYQRSDANSPFGCVAEVKWTLQQVVGSTMLMVDSGSFQLADGGTQPMSRWLVVKQNIHLPPSQELKLSLEMTDLNRPVKHFEMMNVDKTTKTSSQNFMLTDALTGEPIFNQFAEEGGEIKIESQRASLPAVKLKHIANPAKLPPPPFSTSLPEMPDITTARSASAIPFDGGLLFTPEEGFYIITADVQASDGYTLGVAHHFYPEIKDVDQLIAPLRYITSKTEYNEIESSNYPKQLVDNFWLDCGGSKDKARDLVRIYYNRVQEANRAFSTHTEGWRTDRGMIHLVFGNPNKIYRYDDSETWIYGEEGNVSTLQFVFRRQSSSLSDNVFVLTRDPLLKAYWERAVTAWRSGKVYGD